MLKLTKISRERSPNGWHYQSPFLRGKAVCNTCHVDGTENSTTPITAANVAFSAPVFTDFTSVNIGIPRNSNNPIYFPTTPDGFGFTPNPVDFAFTDFGVALFLRSVLAASPNADWIPLAPQFDGAMQLATASNVDMRPCPSFVKAYMHNGYLKSLKEVVHFYNTRDVVAQPV